MAIEQDKIGLEVYKVLSAPGYGFNISMYTADGKGTITPMNAKWLYIKPQNIMITLPEQDKPSKPEIYLWKQQNIDDDLIVELIQRLRKVANQFGIGLTVNDFAHEDTPKAFAKAAAREQEETKLNESYLAEGMTGSAKRSYLTLENARMVVIHSKNINEESHGSRARNISEIFIESHGERYRYPTKYLPGARAITSHLSFGGSWEDKVGRTLRECGFEVIAYRKLINEAKTTGSTRLLEKATRYVKETQTMARKMQGPRGYVRLSESIMKAAVIGSKAIQTRSRSLSSLSGLTESEELVEAYRFMARRDIREDLDNRDIYSAVIQEALIDISPRDAKKTSNCIIKGTLGLKQPLRKIHSNPDTPQQKVLLLSDALSEAVDNVTVATALSEIAEKSSPSTNDAKFVAGVYKTVRMNETAFGTQDTGLHELLEWSKLITKGFIK